MSKEILAELEQIAEANDGLLRPVDVVEFAKDPNTALHSRFEWDNNQAAHNYRLWQARQVIRVTIETLPREEMEYRVFVSLPDDRRMPNGGYRPFQDVMTNEMLRQKLMGQARKEANIFQNKYKHLRELAPIFEAMTAVFDEVHPMLEQAA